MHQGAWEVLEAQGLGSLGSAGWAIPELRQSLGEMELGPPTG